MTRDHHMRVKRIIIQRNPRGEHQLSLGLEGAWVNDIPGVSKATLCNVSRVAIKEPETTLLANFRQPHIDAGKGTMVLPVAVCATIPDGKEGIDQQAAQAEMDALHDLLAWCEDALHDPDAEMVLSIDWADPVREPELFGGGK